VKQKHPKHIYYLHITATEEKEERKWISVRINCINSSHHDFVCMLTEAAAAATEAYLSRVNWGSHMLTANSTMIG
jgi:hypothetical protein